MAGTVPVADLLVKKPMTPGASTQKLPITRGKSSRMRPEQVYKLSSDTFASPSSLNERRKSRMEMRNLVETKFAKTSNNEQVSTKYGESCR